MFHKILCPIDFSASSQQAMRVATRLANKAGAELELLHSLHLPPLALSIEVPYPADVIDQMVADDDRAFTAAIGEAKNLGAQRVTNRIVRGAPAEQICMIADAEPRSDLIVMGTHGRTGVRRLLLGSVAETVVRHAPCSVLAVRGRDDHDTFRHVLCPVDFSPSSKYGIDLAAELAEKDGLGITLLHVLDLPVGYSGEPTTLDFVSGLDRTSSELLDRWADELRAKVQIPVTKRTLIGNPAEQILTALDQDLTYDLVIVGTHGRTGLSRALLGSVAEKIVRTAPCAVLVARPPG